MRFFKASVWSASSVAVKSLGSFAINKLIALYYGPQGITLFAHFQNFLTIVLTISTDGVNRGLIKYLADKSLHKEKYIQIFNASVYLNFLLFFLAFIFTFFFKEYFFELFGLTEDYLWFGAIFLAVFFHFLNYFFTSVLLAHQHIRKYAWLNIISTLVSIVALYMFRGLPIEYIILIYSFGTSSTFILGFIWTFRIRDFKKELSEKNTGSDSYKMLLHFVLMAASVMLFSKVVDFFVRDYVIGKFDVYQTGLWQSVARFSDYYSLAFTTILSTVYYPKISELINDKKQLRGYILYVLKILTPIVAIGLLVIYFFKEQVLVLFFDKSFVEGAYLFDYQLLGDFFKLISYIFAFIISAQARTVLFIVSQAVSAFVYMLLVYFLTDLAGLEGLTMAHAIRFFIWFVVMFFLYKNLLFGKNHR